MLLINKENLPINGHTAVYKFKGMQNVGYRGNFSFLIGQVRLKTWKMDSIIMFNWAHYMLRSVCNLYLFTKLF